MGAVGCGTAGPITPLSSGKPLPKRILLLKMWNFLQQYLIAKLDQLTMTDSIAKLTGFIWKMIDDDRVVLSRIIFQPVKIS